MDSIVLYVMKTMDRYKTTPQQNEKSRGSRSLLKTMGEVVRRGGGGANEEGHQ